MVWFMLLLLLSLAQPAWADITSNRILYVRFNEGTGTTLADTGSGAHTASTANPSWQLGVPNCQEDDCLGFNGTSTTMTINDATDLSWTNGSGTDTAFSITMWIYINTISAYQMILTKGTSASNVEWQLWKYTSPDRVILQIFGSGASTSIGRSAPLSGITANTWVHLAVTYSGSEINAGVKIYLNGSLADTTNEGTGSYTGTTNNTATVDGGHYNGTARFAGRIDELKFFTRELTASDVTEDMNALSASSAVRKRLIIY